MLFGDLSMPPQPSSLEIQAESYRKQWLQVTNVWSCLWLWQMLLSYFSSVGDSVRNKVSVLELYKISILFFLTFRGKSCSSWDSKNWFLLLGCLELAFHTGMSHATAIQTFFFKSSKHSITDAWCPALIKCKHLVQYNARPV